MQIPVGIRQGELCRANGSQIGRRVDWVGRVTPLTGAQQVSSPLISCCRHMVTWNGVTWKTHMNVTNSTEWPDTSHLGFLSTQSLQSLWTTQNSHQLTLPSCGSILFSWCSSLTVQQMSYSCSRLKMLCEKSKEWICTNLKIIQQTLSSAFIGMFRPLEVGNTYFSFPIKLAAVIDCVRNRKFHIMNFLPSHVFFLRHWTTLFSWLQVMVFKNLNPGQGAQGIMGNKPFYRHCCCVFIKETNVFIVVIIIVFALYILLSNM